MELSRKYCLAFCPCAFLAKFLKGTMLQIAGAIILTEPIAAVSKQSAGRGTEEGKEFTSPDVVISVLTVWVDESSFGQQSQTSVNAE